VTYPLVILGILAVLFDLLLLWSFGSQLEAEWGSRRWAVFLILATLSAGLLGFGTSLLLPSSAFGGAGWSPTITAALFAWMLMGPESVTNVVGVLAIKRKWFALLAIVVVFFSEIEVSRSIPRLVFVLGGLPFAWWWVRGRRRSIARAVRAPRFLRRRKF